MKSQQSTPSLASMFSIIARSAPTQTIESRTATAPVALKVVCPDCKEGTLYQHSRGRVCVCNICLHDFLYVNGKVERR